MGVLILLACILGFSVSVYAKDTVAKVTSKRYSNSKTQYSVISGKTQAGKTVWKYTTSKFTATELDSASYKVRGSYVYLIDHTANNMLYIKLNKQTGKVVCRKKFSSSYNMGGAAMYVDSSGNLYSMGYYNDWIAKFSSKGKLLWKKKINSKYYWPSKMTASNNKLTVYFDGYYNGRVILNMKTGKILSYK